MSAAFSRGRKIGELTGDVFSIDQFIATAQAIVLDNWPKIEALAAAILNKSILAGSEAMQITERI